MLDETAEPCRLSCKPDRENCIVMLVGAREEGSHGVLAIRIATVQVTFHTHLCAYLLSFPDTFMNRKGMEHTLKSVQSTERATQT
jgi:hypothetical protein